MTLSTRGIPDIMAYFGMKNILNDVGCKLTMYFYRVGRGLSIGTTCLQSIFQVITISPINSKWVWLKLRINKCVLPFFLFIWIINMVIHIPVIYSLQASENFTLYHNGYSMKYCVTKPNIPRVGSNLFITAMTTSDFFFLTLMSLASGYMVAFLYRHKKNIQHIRNTSLSSRSSCETRATQTILLLVGFYVIFYWIGCCLIIYLAFSYKKDMVLGSIGSVLNSCYPVLCPFILASTDFQGLRLTCILRKNLVLNPHLKDPLHGQFIPYSTPLRVSK
ncbi:vomeronasal type-1 receptor 4-like [Gracilinanus agilis]|uniref:vomeronasal type-1 receptor 4-like n=1 Tax=Gracilinanus agilis TaxID=191870 RepID=UPI001CFE445D|nr:vomeronasal type-1 receptor 4-like [Gracilinanus agilis]